VLAYVYMIVCVYRCAGEAGWRKSESEKGMEGVELEGKREHRCSCPQVVVAIVPGDVKSLLRKQGMEVDEDEVLGRVVALAPRSQQSRNGPWMCRYDPLDAAGPGHVGNTYTPLSQSLMLAQQHPLPATGFIFTPLDGRMPRILVQRLPEHVDATQPGYLFPIRYLPC
jgi:hypothetical protein